MINWGYKSRQGGERGGSKVQISVLSFLLIVCSDSFGFWFLVFGFTHSIGKRSTGP